MKKLITTILLLLAVLSACGEEPTLEWKDRSGEFFCLGYHYGGRVAQGTTPEPVILPCNPPETPGNYVKYWCEGAATGFLEYSVTLYGSLWALVDPSLTVYLTGRCIEDRWWDKAPFHLSPLVTA